MRRRMLSKGLTVAVIFLFIGIAVQPGIATIPIDDEIDVDAEEYLFQTIIDIANNPNVRDFLKQNMHKMFTSDFDFKGLNSKLLVKNPRFFTRLLVTRPTLTHGYLDRIYSIGSDMSDILGEEQVYEIKDTITITDTEFYDGLENIVLNDEELSNRIDTLLEINSKGIIKDIICGILYAIAYRLWSLFFTVFAFVVFGFLVHPFMSLLAIIPLVIIFTITWSNDLLMRILDCPVFPVL